MEICRPQEWSSGIGRSGGIRARTFGQLSKPLISREHFAYHLFSRRPRYRDSGCGRYRVRIDDKAGQDALFPRRAEAAATIADPEAVRVVHREC